MTARRLSLVRPGTLILGAVVMLALPEIAGLVGSQVQKLDEILSIMVLAIALNIAAGFAGQFLLGLGAVFAVGGYASALLANAHPSVGFLGMAAVAVVAGTAFGAIVGLPALRVGGFYLGVVTLFAAVVVPLIASNSARLGGATGIALFANSDFNPSLTVSGIYLTFVVIVLGLTFASWALLHSRLGHRFLVLANSEELASSLGIPSYRTKMAAVVISSAVAGLGGAMYTYSQQFFAPSSADVTLSILVLAAVVIGGLGKVLAPIVGCAIVFGLNTFLTFQQYTGIVFGIFLLGFILFAPQGVVAAFSQVAQALHIPPFAWHRRETTALLEQPQVEGGPALEIRDVHRAFAGVRAVDGVSMRVRPAELHGLIGRASCRERV